MVLDGWAVGPLSLVSDQQWTPSPALTAFGTGMVSLPRDW
jgi:hypothetical protein